MPKRIDSQTDMAILRDIGMGQKNKDIAKEYGVSPSYVSKLKTGKKVPDVYVAKTKKANHVNVDAIVAALELNDMLPNNDFIIGFLKQKLADSIIESKVYLTLLRKYEGEK